MPEKADKTERRDEPQPAASQGDSKLAADIVTVVYEGPHGKIVDGELEFPAGIPVPVDRARFEDLVARLEATREEPSAIRHLFSVETPAEDAIDVTDGSLVA